MKMGDIYSSHREKVISIKEYIKPVLKIIENSEKYLKNGINLHEIFKNK